MHTFFKDDLKVTPAFVEKFAQRYINQRTEKITDVASLTASVVFNKTGFDTKALEKIINSNLVAIDQKRNKDKTPAIINDIYRSDLGEMLMTYYFEEKIIPDHFNIPIKNISYRELADQPGRGLDALGYNEKNDRINLLFGEAKVSAEKKNPPQVVDVSGDSIYNTQLKYHSDKSKVLAKLSDAYKRMGYKDASVIGAAILAIEQDLDDIVTLTYGCVLIRDSSCVDYEKDYGKMKSEEANFNPNHIHFSILAFDKTIEETVQLFYLKVQELIAA